MDYTAHYFVIETQLRADGDVNKIMNDKGKFANALSYYYQRKAAYVVDTTYVQAGVMITDANLNVIQQDNITTQYVAPTTTEETEE